MTSHSARSTGGRGAALRPRLYEAQRAYIALLFEVLGRLLAAASAVDPVIRAELASFPEGCTIGFSVLGASPNIRLVFRAGRLRRSAHDGGKADVEVVFKHISHAFAALSFREITPVAYANDRMVTHGDVALTMRLVRCLDRAQGVLLPRRVAELALRSPPTLTAAEKLLLSAKIIGRLLKDASHRSAE